MKKLLSILFFAVTLNSNAQSLVLTQSFNEPVIGDTSRVHALDTSAYSSGMPLALTGSNVAWNFTMLNTFSPVILSAYVSPTAVASSTAYPGCTMVQKQGGLNSYFKSVTSPTPQTEFLGLSSNTLNMNLSNSAIAARFPMTYANSIADPFSGTFSFSVSGNVNGNVNTVADGSGTLNLPMGISLTNVLRVKSVQNMTLTSGFFPVGTIKQINYYFYHASEKFPVLNINYTTIALSGQTPSTTAGATGNINYFVVGLNENSPLSEQLSIYPNPASENLYLAAAVGIKINRVTIKNIAGQIVYSDTYNDHLEIGKLAPAVYFLEIHTEQGTARKKFIKQ